MNIGAYMDLTSGYLILFMAFLLYYPIRYFVMKNFLPRSDEEKYYRRPSMYLHAGIAVLYSLTGGMVFVKFAPDETFKALLYLSFCIIITSTIGYNHANWITKQQ